jgi:Na+-translocating ferredoxin:NAD+ oxidoreductase subunit C
MFWKRKWGIHPEYNKTVTGAKSIETGPIPGRVIIPVRQHIGNAAVAVVSKGDHVFKGQLIAKADGMVSANIHASISGTVAEILNKQHPVYGEGTAIVIDSDGKDEWLEGLLVDRDWNTLTIEQMVEFIRNAGIVGMGGAAFPSHVKLLPPKDKKIDTLIINAAECEPFLTVDHRIMLEYTERIYTGVAITAKILGVDNIIIGIEDNKMDAVRKLSAVFEGSNTKVIAVPTRYPQGAEKMLIKTLVDREVQPGKLPMDVGIVVQNVSTTVAICDAVRKNIPLIERVVTISGGAIKEPKNLMLRIGTTFSDAINICGGFKVAPAKVIMGGPMMGISQYTIEVPIVKGTSGILALSKKDINPARESACIHCGRCVKNCPMGLNPGMLSTLGEREMFEEAKDTYYLFDCIECGSCSFNCPARRNIVHYIKYLKRLSAEKAAQNKGGAK